MAVTDTPQHPRLIELFAFLDDQRAVLRSAVDSVPPSLHYQQPSDERWSVAHVLEHLALLEPRLARLFTRRLTDAIANGLQREIDTTPVVARLNVPRVLDRSYRVTAIPDVQPRGELGVEDAWGALETTLPAIRAAVMPGDGLALATIVFPHPVLGPLDLYQWIAFVGAHEARHAAQIREVGRQLAEAHAG